jgi:hypothetical protein
LPPGPQCETRNACPNLTIQHVKSKPSFKKKSATFSQWCLNYIVYFWICIWVIGNSGGQITSRQSTVCEAHATWISFLGRETGFCEMQLPERQHWCTIGLRCWNIFFYYSAQILGSRIFLNSFIIEIWCVPGPVWKVEDSYKISVPNNFFRL